MRKLLTFVLALGLVVGLSGPASAGFLNDAATGLNGVVTAVADPLVGLVQGDDRFAVPVVAPVTNRLVGLLTGTLTGVNRLVRGAVDLPLAVLPVGPLSPEPRFVVVPGTTTAPTNPF